MQKKKGMRIFSLLFFIFEIIYRHNVGYYYKGEIILNRKKIARNY